MESNQDCRDLDLRYVSFAELMAESDVVSMHAPLLPITSHLINEQTIALMKKGVMLTGHQGSLTKEALEDIAQTTVENILEFATTGACRNQRKLEQ